MKSEAFYRGFPGRKYGIYNTQRKCFQFDICEDSPMLAMARLHYKIGKDARKDRFEPRMLPKEATAELTSAARAGHIRIIDEEETPNA